jgi:hypothetical protein
VERLTTTTSPGLDARIRQWASGRPTPEKQPLRVRPRSGVVETALHSRYRPIRRVVGVVQAPVAAILEGLELLHRRRGRRLDRVEDLGPFVRPLEALDVRGGQGSARVSTFASHSEACRPGLASRSKATQRPSPDTALRTAGVCASIRELQIEYRSPNAG